jgi:hypothetical protein
MNYKQIITESTQTQKEKRKAINKAYYKAYYEANKEKAKAFRKAYYEANKEKEKAAMKAYNQLNGKVTSKRYRERNKEKLKAYEAEKRKTHKGKLRKAVISAFERVGKNKPTNTLKLLGCSWEEAKAHIENLWQEGMSWDNHGRYGWHIDHIHPVSSFEDHELDQMNHISNLQPLWAKDNLSKSNKVWYT